MTRKGLKERKEGKLRSGDSSRSTNGGTVEMMHRGRPSLKKTLATASRNRRTKELLGRKEEPPPSDE